LTTAAGNFALATSSAPSTYFNADDDLILLVTYNTL
jgi:hypothetical protein